MGSSVRALAGVIRRWFRRYQPEHFSFGVSRFELERLCFEEPEVATDVLAPFGLTIDDVRRWDQPFPSLPSS